MTVVMIFDLTVTYQFFLIEVLIGSVLVCYTTFEKEGFLLVLMVR